MRSSWVDGSYELKTVGSLEVADDRVTHLAWSSWDAQHVEPRKSHSDSFESNSR